MPFKNYRTESREQYGRELESGANLNCEQLQTGALLRIADATEVMAKEYNKLISDYNYMRGERDRYKNRLEAAMNSNRTLKGQITKLKNKLKPNS